MPDGDGPPAMLLFVAPRSEWTMLDDWGDTLGLKGSGSHSVRFDGGRIPAHCALENTTMVDVDVSGGTPGSALHGNPMYAAGRSRSSRSRWGRSWSAWRRARWRSTSG